MKKVATIILPALAILLTVIAACFASYNAGKAKAYSHHIEYFNKTEALLDSINKWDESFMDTTMETDTYYEYEVAREKFF